MYYTYHKRNNPEQVLVYIEEFNKADKTVLMDFIDSNEYGAFGYNGSNCASDFGRLVPGISV